MYRVRLILTGLALILLNQVVVSQQLKLGNNPFTVQKSAILDMESTNQGLLLVRITDTTGINALTPPDGMVIYFTPIKQLMVRTNGAWQAITSGAIDTTNIANFYLKVRAKLSAGTGISYNNTTGVITNSSPDQTVALTAGTGIGVSGTYPNFTITNSSPSSGGTVTSVTSANGNATVATTTTTPVITINAAPKLSTARLIQGASFDGTADINPINGTGFVKATGTTLSYDNSTYLTGNQTITLSGDVTGSGATAITTTLANSGVTAGTYGTVTVDAKGRVTAGKRQETYSGVTNASGTYTVTFATAYSVAPNIQVTLTGASDVQSYRVTSITTTGFTVLTRSQALGLIFSNATGVNVDVLITEK